MSGSTPARHKPSAIPADFHNRYPSYEDTSVLDKLRATDFARLDKQKEIYLDYTGGSLYPVSLLHAHTDFLEQQVLGNPHSANPSSRRSTQLVAEARKAVLDFFKASAEEYTVVFTQNASGALKLVGESYPFNESSCFLQLIDNHNSVTGIREYARARGSKALIVPGQPHNLRIATREVQKRLRTPVRGHKLFAYPAQSNFSGVQHPLAWIEDAQTHGWHVFLDAAAFAPTNSLDLSRYHPDFVSLSFYKMFGWPTGIGCLIARKEALGILERPWFSGGTVAAASTQGGWHILASNEEAFEDGTVNYLMLPAVTEGLRYLRDIGMHTIHTRVETLTGWLLERMQALQHTDGSQLLRIYGPLGTNRRGGTIACNFLDPEGHIIDERLIEAEAAAARISIRTGCFCNPGAGETAFKLDPVFLSNQLGGDTMLSYDEFLERLGMESGGAIRISVGLASNLADIEAFLTFASRYIDRQITQADLAPLPERKHC